MLYAVSSGIGIPKAEAVVVLGDKDDIIHSRLIGCADPLIGINGGWLVRQRLNPAVRPLDVPKGVYAKMKKHAKAAFDLLELELIWAGGGDRRNQMATHNQIPFSHDLFDIIIAGTSWA